MPKLILVGAGHAHLMVLANLKRFTGHGHRVTVVSKGEFQYYSGMGPGLLAGTYTPEMVRFDVGRMARSGDADFIPVPVVAVDARSRRLILADGRGLSYDVASFNTGSRIAFDAPPEDPSVVTVKPIEGLRVAADRLRGLARHRSVRVLVAGGGPAGVEIAGNLRRLARMEGLRFHITLVAGRRLLSGFPDRARSLTIRAFGEGAGTLGKVIQVREGVRVTAAGYGQARLSDGSILPADMTFLATGTRPSRLFAESGLPVGPGGGLLVNAFLQSPEYPNIFGGGDGIDFGPRPLPRVGVYAMRQNPILLNNLLAALEGGPLREFRPQKRVMLLLNLGDSTAIFLRGPVAWRARWVFALKNAIDLTFMGKFRKNRFEEK